jgi:hypothetical protein
MALQGCLNGDSGSEELGRGHTPLVGLDRFFGRQTSGDEQARSHRILLRPAETSSGDRSGRDIYRAHEMSLRDMSKCEDRIRALSNAVCKSNHTIS